jgi:hypothetical protein
MRLVAMLLMVAACGSAGSATVVEVPPQDLPPPQPTQQVVVEAAPVFRAGEQWVGTYVCAQGRTDLVLHIDRVAADTVDAVFEFSHSPSGAGGAYQMRGTIDGSAGVHLVPGRWLDQPPNYVSVGMTGAVRGDAFTGRMDNPSCGSFTLQRR